MFHLSEDFERNKRIFVELDGKFPVAHRIPKPLDSRFALVSALQGRLRDLIRSHPVANGEVLFFPSQFFKVRRPSSLGLQLHGG